VARTVTVKLRDADFTTRQASRTLADAVQADRAVYAVARGLLSRLRAARRVPARLIGVALSQLVEQSGEVSYPCSSPAAARWRRAGPGHLAHDRRGAREIRSGRARPGRAQR